MSTFCTAINCMDGRIQIPVIQYLKQRFNADYVDVVSEPGPNGILAEGSDHATVRSIERRVGISVEHHHSVGIAIVGHHDCAGNPAPPDVQSENTTAAVRYIRDRFQRVPVIGLWVNENWQVVEIGM